MRKISWVSVFVVLSWSMHFNIHANPPAIFRGKISHFGGPEESAHERNRSLAIYPNKKVASLKEDDYYCAMRWDYKKHPRNWLQTIEVTITAMNGKTIKAKPVDWGPGKQSRIIDVSPGIMKALGIKTDDTVVVLIPER